MNILAEGLYVLNSAFVHINYVSAYDDPSSKTSGSPFEIVHIILLIIGVIGLATALFLSWRIFRNRKKKSG
jgi:hypothetical protein